MTPYEVKLLRKKESKKEEPDMRKSDAAELLNLMNQSHTTKDRKQFISSLLKALRYELVEALDERIARVEATLKSCDEKD